MEKKNKNQEALYIGAKIKELRLSKGLTQEQLSEKIGIDNKKLSRIETCRTMPSLNIAKDLTKILNFNIYDLIETPLSEKIEIPDNYFMQSLNILKSAKNVEEKKCYLNALKHTQKCLNMGKN